MLKTFQAENFPKLISRFLVISSKSSKTSPKQDKYMHNNNTKNKNKLYLGMDFPRGSVVKKKMLPAMQKTWIQSLGQEDPLEKELANPSSILTWEIPWTEEPGWLQSTGLQRVRNNLATEHILVCLGISW